ncbi:neuronal pentraxin-2-like [Ptychodera flava]|uniref:neuronal pentraxin-2-like n=1 Tax=Ptychodera flava TaxID=63121 RepID=UPI00396A484F
MFVTENIYQNNNASYNAHIVVNEKKHWFRGIPSFLSWKFWCFTCNLNSHSTEYLLYINGIRINIREDVTSGKEPSNIEGGGLLILGQDQDKVGGKFDLPQAFQGDMTEFNLWDRFISQQEIQLLMMSTCGIGDRDVIVSWQSSTFELFHVTERDQMHFDDKCKY